MLCYKLSDLIPLIEVLNKSLPDHCVFGCLLHGLFNNWHGFLSVLARCHQHDEHLVLQLCVGYVEGDVLEVLFEKFPDFLELALHDFLVSYDLL